MAELHGAKINLLPPAADVSLPDLCGFAEGVQRCLRRSFMSAFREPRQQSHTMELPDLGDLPESVPQKFKPIFGYFSYSEEIIPLVLGSD